MKYVAILGFFGLSACVQPTNMAPIANPGVPPLSCVVADFTSDTGDARFNNGNRAKTFEIRSTADGFIVDASSDVFTDSTNDFAVVTVTTQQITAIRRGQRANDTLNFSLIVDRAAPNGVRRVVQTMQVKNSDRPAGFTQNQWTLACR